MAGLPAALFDVDVPGPSQSSDSPVGQLLDLLWLHRDLDFGLDQDMVPVPRKAVGVFDPLAAGATQECGRKTRLATALITDESDTNLPVAKEWADSYGLFPGWTLLGRRHV